jgi:heptosyltransferase I
MIESICLVRLSALGDILMLLPLVRTLQARLPKVQVTWIIARPAFDLLEGIKDIEFIVIEKPNSIADYWRFKKRMSTRVFDVLLATQASLRTNLLYPLIKAKRKIGYDYRRANDGQFFFVKERVQPGFEHTLDGFLKFAKPLGIEESHLSWDLALSNEEYDFAKTHLPQGRRILAVNPAASKPERSWLVDRYIEVLQQAQARFGVEIVLTGGPSTYDRELADQILQKVVAIDLVGKTKPRQLLAILSRVDCVLCPDTGPSHMANAVGTPVVALHAVTNPFISGPYHFQELVVNAYPQALQGLLGICIDKHQWGTQVHSQQAMAYVTVEAVMAQLSKVFNDLRGRKCNAMNQ